MNKILKKGDILLFKADDDDPIGKLIEYLTDSDVSHTAMVYSDDSIVHLCDRGIGAYYIQEKQGNNAYVMRLKSNHNPKPFILAANSYLFEKSKFNYSALIPLAILLILRKFIFKKNLSDISCKIIKAASLELNEYQQQIRSSKKPVIKMICSQLIYQIYYNSGSDNRIKLKDPILPIKEIQNRLEQELSTIEYTDGSNNLQASPDELAKELLHQLNSTSHKPDFLHGIKTPIRNNLVEKIVTITEKAEIEMALESQFVLPADLLKHAPNLELVGKCNIERWDPNHPD